MAMSDKAGKTRTTTASVHTPDGRKLRIHDAGIRATDAMAKRKPKPRDAHRLAMNCVGRDKKSASLLMIGRDGRGISGEAQRDHRSDQSFGSLPASAGPFKRRAERQISSRLPELSQNCWSGQRFLQHGQRTVRWGWRFIADRAANRRRPKDPGQTHGEGHGSQPPVLIMLHQVAQRSRIGCYETSRRHQSSHATDHKMRQ
jgi:hypothetical protein